MLPRDLLRGNSVYMVCSCRVRLLHIIHVSAVSEVGVLQEKCSRQPVPCDTFKLKFKIPPGLAAVAHLLRAACRRVNIPVVFLCFYCAARLSRHSRAACCVPCKHSFIWTIWTSISAVPRKAVNLITHSLTHWGSVTYTGTSTYGHHWFFSNDYNRNILEIFYYFGTVLARL